MAPARPQIADSDPVSQRDTPMSDVNDDTSINVAPERADDSMVVSLPPTLMLRQWATGLRLPNILN